MIEKGTTVVLHTEKAIYSTCKVVAISEQNVTVTYCAGQKRDRTTGEFKSEWPVETIPMKSVVKMSERF